MVTNQSAFFQLYQQCSISFISIFTRQKIVLNLFNDLPFLTGFVLLKTFCHHKRSLKCFCDAISAKLVVLSFTALRVKHTMNLRYTLTLLTLTASQDCKIRAFLHLKRAHYAHFALRFRQFKRYLDLFAVLQGSARSGTILPQLPLVLFS